MVLQPFSIPDHIPKIKDGTKSQTTRRGLRDLKLGTRLQQYYKPRMKKSCVNCISVTCKNSVLNSHLEWPVIDCMGHENYLGEVPVTECIQYPFGLQEMNKTEFEEWAKADGFNCVGEAVEFFESHYGVESHYGAEWREIPMTVIKWDNSDRVLK